ncbi:Fibropellin-1 [Holothuria leucospilota]|uniref:Fibropellin-1 n=1 Tax=Holothuria leucospilota TaxID=206669 RepID=A0A9Q1BWW0_HOLLE|nr:Fibropellin-1 [Holothuria leucospilota]
MIWVQIRRLEPRGTTRPGPPNCPDSAVTVTTVGGSASAVATYGPFTCSDAEQGSIIASCNPMSGTPFNIGGNNVVTCTCTDNGGLQSSCTFFVNVTRGNTQPGPPNCPFDGVTVFTVGGSARATYGPFVCSDAEQGSIITTCNPASGTTFSIGGNNVVTCTCTDNGGLQSSCTFFVNIMQENAPPGPPDCPNNGVTVVTVGGSTTAVATYGPFVCSDAEQGPITATCNPVSGTTFSIGNNVVACTCTDNGGRRSSCTFFVNIIRGNTPPGPPNCPNNGVTVVTIGGSLTAVATYGPFVCSDAEQGPITATCNPVSGSQFSIGGLNTVTCTCTDNGGLQSNCNFRVTVSCSDACSFNNRCVNGGTCRVYPGSCTQTFCDCPPCFTGADCQIDTPIQASSLPLLPLNHFHDRYDFDIFIRSALVMSIDVKMEDSVFQTDKAVTPTPVFVLDAQPDRSVMQVTVVFCDKIICGVIKPYKVFNPCSRSPCLNGGVCTNIAETCASYSCACTGCFTGYNCQTPIPDPCLAAPCLNGGSCRRELGTCFGYTCQCLPGFEGVVCENNAVILRDPCASFPCQHYGWCIPLGGNDFKCLCRSQYTGIQCADMTANVIGSNSCLTNRCSNGGTCFNSYNSNSGSIIFAPQYTCVCAPGFAGQNCNLPTAFNTQLDTCTTAGVVCLNGGTCRNTFCSFSGDIGTYCECRIGFYGERCQIVDVNPCQSNPCRNDGQCTPFKNYFDCQCLATFSGPTCEVVGPRGSCIINPCRNGGTCFDGIAGFICLCTPFYTGVFCETFIQQEGCFFNPCLNGGTCLDGFRCLCPPSFTGPTCATFIPQPECPINPCLNGGTCLEGFRCLCLPFYTGPTCATFCASRPCLNGGTCIDLTNAIGSFLCLCTSSFSGRNCEIRSSPCSSNPCVNGGTCSGSSNGFFCLCLPPFTGLTCQDGSSPCSSNPCVNGGTCSGSSNGFFCLCLPPFTGLTCQDGALVYNPGDSLVITSPEFPLAYPPGETQSVVVTSTVNLRVALTFFEVSSLEQLSIGRGSVIGQNRLEEYRNGLFGCTPNEDCVTPINGNTFWVQFVSNANIVADGQGYVLTVAQVMLLIEMIESGPLLIFPPMYRLKMQMWKMSSEESLHG